MLMNRFAYLLRKHCPLCKEEVQEQGDGAVQRFGKWFCSKVHADLYEWKLYEALRTVHCHHAGCHGEHVPLPEAVEMSLLGRKMELADLRADCTRCFTPTL
jgi:hypothetical protein